MAENSKIEWTDHTFNPWIGCQKVGPGCDHCYAEAWDARGLQGQPSRWGAHAARARKRAPRPAEETGRTILFPIRLLDRLGPHAAKRGIHPNHLARLLVEVAVDEGLIDSILDDAEVAYA